jgi:hypothetical protein
MPTTPNTTPCAVKPTAPSRDAHRRRRGLMRESSSCSTKRRPRPFQICFAPTNRATAAAPNTRIRPAGSSSARAVQLRAAASPPRPPSCSSASRTAAYASDPYARPETAWPARDATAHAPERRRPPVSAMASTTSQSPSAASPSARTATRIRPAGADAIDATAPFESVVRPPAPAASASASTAITAYTAPRAAYPTRAAFWKTGRRAVRRPARSTASHPSGPTTVLTHPRCARARRGRTWARRSGNRGRDRLPLAGYPSVRIPRGLRSGWVSKGGRHEVSGADEA